MNRYGIARRVNVSVTQLNVAVFLSYNPTTDIHTYIHPSIILHLLPPPLVLLLHYYFLRYTNFHTTFSFYNILLVESHLYSIPQHNIDIIFAFVSYLFIQPTAMKTSPLNSRRRRQPGRRSNSVAKKLFVIANFVALSFLWDGGADVYCRVAAKLIRGGGQSNDDVGSFLEKSTESLVENGREE